MYTDKDNNGNISIMEINPDEIKDITSILLQFEYLVGYSALSIEEKAIYALLSAKLRFMIIDELNK